MHLLLATRVLADDGNGPSGALGLVVFLCLLVGCVFLFRSLAGRIKRLPTSFDPPADGDSDPSADAAVDAVAQPVRPADGETAQ